MSLKNLKKYGQNLDVDVNILVFYDVLILL